MKKDTQEDSKANFFLFLGGGDGGGGVKTTSDYHLLCQSVCVCVSESEVDFSKCMGLCAS